MTMTAHTRRRTVPAALAAAALAATLAAAPRAGATPSTQVWIPSPDVQRFETLHLNYDVYARPGRTPLLVLGPTVGVLPFDKVQAELGFDLMFQGDEALDGNPIYFHGKVAVPEDAFFRWQPSLAVGVYNVGTKRSPTVNTMQNIGYALVGRTLPIIGRISAGYYLGNAAVLRTNIVPGDPSATRPDNHGLLLSWDRTLSEISDKLWMAVDYQQGRSGLGSINAGVSWAFSKDVSVVVGYDHYWNHTIAGKDTFTVQLDVNLFMPKERAAAENPAGDSPAPGEKPAGVLGSAERAADEAAAGEGAADPGGAGEDGSQDAKAAAAVEGGEKKAKEGAGAEGIGRGDGRKAEPASDTGAGGAK